MKFVKDTLYTFSILAIHERIFYSKYITLLPLTDVADVMLTQSGEKVNHLRSKGHVSALLLTSCFGLFISRLTLFEKNIIMSISWEMILKDDCITLA